MVSTLKKKKKNILVVYYCCQRFNDKLCNGEGEGLGFFGWGGWDGLQGPKKVSREQIKPRFPEIQEYRGGLELLLMT